MSELEDLRIMLVDEKYEIIDSLLDQMEEDLSMFRLGQYRGRIQALDEMIETLRQRIKFNDK